MHSFRSTGVLRDTIIISIESLKNKDVKNRDEFL